MNEAQAIAVSSSVINSFSVLLASADHEMTEFEREALLNIDTDSIVFGKVARDLVDLFALRRRKSKKVCKRRFLDVTVHAVQQFSGGGRVTIRGL